MFWLIIIFFIAYIVYFSCSYKTLHKSLHLDGIHALSMWQNYVLIILLEEIFYRNMLPLFMFQFMPTTYAYLFSSLLFSWAHIHIGCCYFINYSMLYRIAQIANMVILFILSYELLLMQNLLMSFVVYLIYSYIHVFAEHIYIYIVHKFIKNCEICDDTSEHYHCSSIKNKLTVYVDKLRRCKSDSNLQYKSYFDYHDKHHDKHSVTYQNIPDDIHTSCRIYQEKINLKMKYANLNGVYDYCSTDDHPFMLYNDDIICRPCI